MPADLNTIARPYAEALFALVRARRDRLDELSESLGVARALMADGQVETFLANPALDDAQRLEFLQGLFAAAAGQDSVFAGAREHGGNFLRILLENDRVAALPAIADRYEALKARVQNTLDVVVTSATPLSGERQADLARALRARLGREVRLATAIDEGLLGGAVIRAGDIVIDGSVSSRLDSLTNALLT